MDIKILIAAHKPYRMPEDTSLYLPVQVGCDEVDERFGYQCDNTGDNISYKHRFYSDLSSLYWGWKNLDCDYLGTCHYRRYFVSNKAKPCGDPFFRYILSRDELEALLERCSVIVAKKRKYYIETMWSHYAHVNNVKDLELLRSVIADECPSYLDSFDAVMKSRSAHIFNTFIMDRKNLDDFCTWMFAVLFAFETQRHIDLRANNKSEMRLCGLMAEYLLDTWLGHTKVPYQEVKLKFMEKQNWLKKGSAFLIRKFRPNVHTGEAPARRAP